MRNSITIMAAIVLAVGATAQGVIYDAYEDFGGEQGANGFWYYLLYTGSTYIPMTYHSSSHMGPYHFWLGTEGDLNWLPCISREYADNVYPEYANVFVMVPGDNFSRYDVVLRWKSPLSGEIVVTATVQKPWDGSGGNGVDVYFEKNGILAHSFTVSGEDFDIHSVELPMSVAVDDLIDLRIYNKGDNGSDGVLVSQIIEVRTLVDIDIKPGSYPNSINPKAGGVIPVAILTTADFDASTVDPETVQLEGADARGKGKSGMYGSMEDVDGDGDLDLVVQIENTINWEPDATEATLTGFTYDGVPVEGTDSVNIVPPE